MLGHHDGIPALKNREAASAAMLKTMGRLKAGKDVPHRRSLIERALDHVEPHDHYWMETLVGQLARETGLESIPAHLCALCAAWAVAESEVARIIRSVNTSRGDPYIKDAVAGLSAAAPEFGKRLRENRVDSDEFFLRVALSHLFRRNPKDTFQMFVIDGMVRHLPRAMKTSIQDFVKSCLERFDEEPAPEGAWGYLLVLSQSTGKSGYFIYEPDHAARNELHQLRNKLEAVTGPLDDKALTHQLAAAHYSNYYLAGKEGLFASGMAPIMELLGQRCLVLYANDVSDDPTRDGVTTIFIPMGTDDPDVARKIGRELPEVEAHDTLRRIEEYIEQIHEADEFSLH